MYEPALEAEAMRIARLPVIEARRELNRVLSRAVGGPGQVDALALDWSARLVTALRERKARIWGNE